MSAMKRWLSWTLAPDSTTAKGRPLRSTSRWCLLPCFPRSVGLGPVSSPPRGGWDAGSVHRGAGPVNFSSVFQLGQQPAVKLFPDSSRLPFLQATKAGGPTAAPKLPGQFPPRDGVGQNEEDSRQGRPIGDPGATAVDRRRWVMGRQQRFDFRPEGVGQEFRGHGRTPSQQQNLSTVSRHAKFAHDSSGGWLLMRLFDKERGGGFLQQRRDLLLTETVALGRLFSIQLPTLVLN